MKNQDDETTQIEKKLAKKMSEIKDLGGDEQEITEKIRKIDEERN